MAATRIRKRAVANAWISDRVPPSPRWVPGIGDEQMTSQPHHMPATHSQRVRSHAQSPVSAARARKHRSMTPITISAMPWACSRSSGRSITP